MPIVFISLGSNLDNPRKHVQTALIELAAIKNTKLIKSSKLYETDPMGPQDQANYINAVAKLKTQLEPIELLDELQAIEAKHGRVRTEERWGPRTLDLDIQLFGDLILNTPRLIVPHYGLKQRQFVLQPLYEIQPDLVLPCGEQLIQLVDLEQLNLLD